MNFFGKIFEYLGDDWFGVVLNLLKLLGVAVSGFAGIVATASDKPKKTPKSAPTSKIGRMAREVFNKKWAVRWAVFGLALALAAQFLDSIKTTADEKASANQAAQQLNAISSLLTRFKKVSVTADFELPNTNLTIKNLADEMDRFDQPHTNGPLPAISLDPYETNIIGLKPELMDPTLIPEWQPLFEYATNTQRCFQWIKINKAPDAAGQEFDVSMYNEFSMSKVDLRYSRSDHCFLLRVQFEAGTNENWQKNRDVGLSDLGDSTLVLGFDNFVPVPQSRLVPFFTASRLVRCDVYFDDHHYYTLDSLNKSPSSSDSIQFEATLPNKEVMRNHQARTNNPI
jgi:hypothetical protein